VCCACLCQACLRGALWRNQTGVFFQTVFDIDTSFQTRGGNSLGVGQQHAGVDKEFTQSIHGNASRHHGHVVSVYDTRSVVRHYRVSLYTILCQEPRYAHLRSCMFVGCPRACMSLVTPFSQLTGCCLRGAPASNL
jgi:hypothetical protein